MVTIDVSKTDPISVRSVFSTESNLLNLRIEKYENRLATYEQKYGMKTRAFMKRFEAGEIGDDEIWFHWSSDFETLELLKNKKQTLESGMGQMIMKGQQIASIRPTLQNQHR
jgi:hypothetical protein